MTVHDDGDRIKIRNRTVRKQLPKKLLMIYEFRELNFKLIFNYNQLQ